MVFSLAAIGRPITRGWDSYCSALTRQPLITKAATSVVGFSVGDAVAQKLTRPKHEPMDWNRVLKMAVFGGIFMGPMSHYWFNLLDKNLFVNNPTSIQSIVTKVLLDQTVQAPIGLTFFYAFGKTWDGVPQDILPTLKSKLWPTLLMSWQFWPIAHSVNFALIPPHQRVLYINVVSIVYTALLSKIAAEPDPDADMETTVKKAS